MTPKAAEIHHTIPIIGLVVPSFWNRTARGLQGSGSLGSERRNIGASRFSARNGGNGPWIRRAACSLLDHAQCGLPIPRLQSEEQRAGFLDVLLGTGFRSGLEGQCRRMIGAADESQCLGQALDGGSV